jgi:osmotically-inducible protein OsmY
MANRNYGDRGNEERSREEGREASGGRGYWGEESRGGYGNPGGGYGRESERGMGDYRRDIDWRSGQGGAESQGGYGGPGGYGGYGGGYSGQGRFGQGGQRGYGNQGGYGGGQGSQYGYSSGGGYTGQQQWQGPYTGRGPRGYQRSSERIQEEVCEILTRHGQIDASGITVEVSNGEVTLIGTVNSRREKRLAEEVIENLSGVRDIHNQLRVAGRGGNGGSQEDLGSEASGVQPAQSARGSLAASGASAAAGTQNAGETAKSRRRT